MGEPLGSAADAPEEPATSGCFEGGVAFLGHLRGAALC